jgi:hypothetical protein
MFVAAQRRMSTLLVASVWTAILAVALDLVYRYGTRTLPQNDEVWVLYDSGPGIHLHWLWSTWAEHRIPLAKLIWKGVLELTGYDFRFGNFLTVLALGAVAGAMMWTARKIRGRTILADSFFPLAIINLGQAQVFLWWCSVNHVLAPIVAMLLLAALVLYGNDLNSAHILWIGVALVVLVLCGSDGLPYVAVLAVWLFWIGIKREYGAWVFLPSVIALVLLAAYFANYTPYFPVNDPPTVPSWPPPAGLYGSTIASLQILGAGLGVATKSYALVWGFGVFLLGFITAAVLIHRALKHPADRFRTLGLLSFLIASAVLVFFIGRFRAGMGLDYIYQGQYLILVVPALCCMYFAWEIRGGIPARLIQWGLVFVLAVLLPLNSRAAVRIGHDIQQKTTAFERDVRKGVPASVLAERYFASDVVPRPEKLTMILKDHKSNHIGIFKDIRNDPPEHVQTIDTATAVLDGITLHDRIASSALEHDTLPSLTWTLTQPRHVYAIRLRYAYIQAAKAWPTLRAYWRNSAIQEFSDSAAFFSTVSGPDQPTWALIDGKIRTDVKVRSERTLTIWIDSEIDQFRICVEPACEVRFSTIELLVSAAQHSGQSVVDDRGYSVAGDFAQDDRNGIRRDAETIFSLPFD